MSNDIKQPLTSSEIASLWNTYIYDSLIVCYKKHASAKAVDPQIQAVLQEALNISEKRTKDIASIFQSDNLPIPIGFTDNDINIEAPQLFSDYFSLFHALIRTRWVLNNTATSLFLSVRPDVRKLFLDAMTASMKLNDDATKLALSKGLLTHSPVLSIPQTPHFVEKPSYIGSIIGEHRPLHVISVMHLFMSIQENLFGRALTTGFSQVAQDPDVRKYLLRGAEISGKHIKVFSSLLSDEDVPVPQSPDFTITNSMIPPFSDKYMMNHVTIVNSLSIADMGTAIGQSTRADIAATYTRLAAEVVQYGEDGFNILIKKGWMEAAPQVIDHKELALSGNPK